MGLYTAKLNGKTYSYELTEENGAQHVVVKLNGALVANQPIKPGELEPFLENIASGCHAAPYFLKR